MAPAPPQTIHYDNSADQEEDGSYWIGPERKPDESKSDGPIEWKGPAGQASSVLASGNNQQQNSSSASFSRLTSPGVPPSKSGQGGYYVMYDEPSGNKTVAQRFLTTQSQWLQKVRYRQELRNLEAEHERMRECVFEPNKGRGKNSAAGGGAASGGGGQKSSNSKGTTSANNNSSSSAAQHSTGRNSTSSKDLRKQSRDDFLYKMQMAQLQEMKSIEQATASARKREGYDAELAAQVQHDQGVAGGNSGNLIMETSIASGNSYIEARKAEAVAARLEQEKKEMAECTFRPNLRLSQQSYRCYRPFADSTGVERASSSSSSRFMQRRNNDLSFRPRSRIGGEQMSYNGTAVTFDPNRPGHERFVSTTSSQQDGGRGANPAARTIDFDLQKIAREEGFYNLNNLLDEEDLALASMQLYHPDSTTMENLNYGGGGLQKTAMGADVAAYGGARSRGRMRDIGTNGDGFIVGDQEELYAAGEENYQLQNHTATSNSIRSYRNASPPEKFSFRPKVNELPEGFHAAKVYTETNVFKRLAGINESPPPGAEDEFFTPPQAFLNRRAREQQEEESREERFVSERERAETYRQFLRRQNEKQYEKEDRMEELEKKYFGQERFQPSINPNSRKIALNNTKRNSYNPQVAAGTTGPSSSSNSNSFNGGPRGINSSSFLNNLDNSDVQKTCYGDNSNLDGTKMSLGRSLQFNAVQKRLASEQGGLLGGLPGGGHENVNTSTSNRTLLEREERRMFGKDNSQNVFASVLEEEDERRLNQRNKNGMLNAAGGSSSNSRSNSASRTWHDEQPCLRDQYVLKQMQDKNKIPPTVDHAFHPTINAKSSKIANRKSLHELSVGDLERKREKVKQLKEQRDSKEFETIIQTKVDTEAKLKKAKQYDAVEPRTQPYRSYYINQLREKQQKVDEKREKDKQQREEKELKECRFQPKLVAENYFKKLVNSGAHYNSSSNLGAGGPGGGGNLGQQQQQPSRSLFLKPPAMPPNGSAAGAATMLRSSKGSSVTNNIGTTDAGSSAAGEVMQEEHNRDSRETTAPFVMGGGAQNSHAESGGAANVGTGMSLLLCKCRFLRFLKMQGESCMVCA
ncbi:unnamed protein product [Amoebophrya sp. A120]|nr:unnamed protein product [Amoebophrya sp. A120]|eukprot:GSA120T00022600001.1